jgi:hypothetical protein
MAMLARNRLRTEVPIPYIFGLFFRPEFQGISPENMALNGTNVPPLKWILKISH